MTQPTLRPGISVVVPVYNSESTLVTLVDRLGAALDDLGLPYEIVLVDDASIDGSWERILVLSKRPRVRGTRLMRNFGQHSALLAGIRSARHELTLTLDDDLQNPPEELATLFAALNPSVDVVYGTPARAQHGLLRAIATYLTKLALKSAMGAEVARKVSTFRIFRTTVRDAFCDYTGPHVAIDVLLSWGTTRFAAVPVRHDQRLSGKSNYSFRKLITHAINMATGFSTRPLKLASFIGFAFSFIGVAVLLYVLVRRLISGVSVPGFTFLASTIAIFSGAQLFALGIIGEYLERMHFRSMEKPAYVLRESTDD